MTPTVEVLATASLFVLTNGQILGQTGNEAGQTRNEANISQNRFVCLK